MQPTKPKPRSLITPLHPKPSSLDPPVPPFRPPLTPPNPQFLSAHWSSPSSGKAMQRGSPKSTAVGPPTQPNFLGFFSCYQISHIPPPSAPSSSPLLSSLLVLSLHPSLPAQCTHTPLTTATTATAHTVLASAPITRSVCWRPRLEPEETLGLSRIGLQSPQPDTHTHTRIHGEIH